MAGSVAPKRRSLHLPQPEVTREMLMTLTADDLRAAEGGPLAEDDLRDAERELEEAKRQGKTDELAAGHSVGTGDSQ